MTLSRAVLDVMPENVAVILVLEGMLIKDTVANPCDPGVLLMVAALVNFEFQVTNVVKSCVLLSEKWPVAVNC